MTKHFILVIVDFHNSNYPQPGSVGNFSKFKDRRFEPQTIKIIMIGIHLGMFRVMVIGIKYIKEITPEIDNIFELGVKNGEKGDFFRIITKCGILNLKILSY